MQAWTLGKKGCPAEYQVSPGLFVSFCRSVPACFFSFLETSSLVVLLTKVYWTRELSFDLPEHLLISQLWRGFLLDIDFWTEMFFSFILSFKPLVYLVGTQPRSRYSSPPTEPRPFSLVQFTFFKSFKCDVLRCSFLSWESGWAAWVQGFVMSVLCFSPAPFTTGSLTLSMLHTFIFPTGC